ncbi:hypothetical protein [Haloechinothrix alba]|nr:hypothetical protein [Haloechinothrix alba]
MSAVAGMPHAIALRAGCLPADGRAGPLSRALLAASGTAELLVTIIGNEIRQLAGCWQAMLRHKRIKLSSLYIAKINLHLFNDGIADLVDDIGARVLFASAGLREQDESVVSLMPSGATRYAFEGSVPSGCESYEAASTEAPCEPLADWPAGAPMIYSLVIIGRPEGIKVPVPPAQEGEPRADMPVAVTPRVFGLGADDAYPSPVPPDHATPLWWSGMIHTWTARWCG